MLQERVGKVDHLQDNLCQQPERMKEDVPGNHPSGLLPILDTQMAIVDGIIVFHHYTKPMASKETILTRSAMSLGSKMNILVAEGSRRLRNCSLELPWATRVEHLNRLSVSMKWAGYNQEVRRTVVTRILARFNQNILHLYYIFS